MADFAVSVIAPRRNPISAVSRGSPGFCDAPSSAGKVVKPQATTADQGCRTAPFRGESKTWGGMAQVGVDLRRRGDDRRASAALCVERAEFLSQEERAMVQAVFRDGLTVKQVAALTACGGGGESGECGGAACGLAQHSSRTPQVAGRIESRARTLRKRLRGITSRLVSPKFEFVASFLEPADQAKRRLLGLPCWPPLRRRVGQECVIRGRSMRQAAALLGVSLHAVRRELAAINALFEARQTR